MQRNWIADLEKRRQDILQDGQNIYIVNAGRMNHGKSSLFNSLLGKKAFKVEDIRTTVIRQEVSIENNVIIVDTPGLDAVESDDKKAFEAYRRANLIIFVHTVKTGAVERDEISSIKRMELEAPSPEYFWKHFVLVFTSIDEYNMADEEDQYKLEQIKKESLKNISDVCGQTGFPVFCVSNTRYQKGRKLHKEKLIELSGVHDLHDYIMSHLSEWRQEQTQLNESRFLQAKRSILDGARSEREFAARRVEDKERKLSNWKNQIKGRLDNLVKELESARRDWQQAWNEYQTM